MFTPVPVEITAYEPEVTGLDLLHKCKFTKLRQVETIPDLARISEGTTKLEVMLDAVISYVQGVLEGREAPNNAVGRKLLDLVNSVPKMNPDEFEKMINSNMKVCIIYNQIRSDTLKYTPQSNSITNNVISHFCISGSSNGYLFDTINENPIATP